MDRGRGRNFLGRPGCVRNALLRIGSVLELWVIVEYQAVAHVKEKKKFSVFGSKSLRHRVALSALQL